MFSVTVLIVIFCVFPSLSTRTGPLCLNCKSLVKPGECREVTRCGVHEHCHMEQFVKNNNIYYDVGCQSTAICNKLSSVFGKRNSVGLAEDDVRSIRCTDCCNGTLCNNGGLCRTPVFNYIGGRMCFNCDQSSTEDGCFQIKLCGQDELCSIHQKIDPTTYNVVWETGCASAGSCIVAPGNICNKCCAGNLCNNNCRHQTSHHTTRIHTTPSTIKQPPLVTISKGSCQHGWIHFQNKCYYFSSEHYAPSDARGYCIRAGSKLAEPRSLASALFLARRAAALGDDFWIGVTWRNDSWSYISDGQEVSVANFYTAKTHYSSSGWGYCIDLHNLYHGKWNVGNCSRNLRFVCESPYSSI